MEKFSKDIGVRENTLRYCLQGTLLLPSDTTDDIGVVDNDTIDVMDIAPKTTFSINERYHENSDEMANSNESDESLLTMHGLEIKLLEYQKENTQLHAALLWFRNKTYALEKNAENIRRKKDEEIRLAKLESDGELKQFMKERDLEMKVFVKTKTDEIIQLKTDKDDMKREIEKLQNCIVKDKAIHENLEEQFLEIMTELQDLKDTHEEVKTWGEFKEREVDQRTRHLVNVKNKMRDGERTIQELNKKMDGYVKELSNHEIQKKNLENEMKANKLALEKKLRDEECTNKELKNKVKEISDIKSEKANLENKMKASKIALENEVRGAELTNKELNRRVDGYA